MHLSEIFAYLKDQVAHNQFFAGASLVGVLELLRHQQLQPVRRLVRFLDTNLAMNTILMKPKRRGTWTNRGDLRGYSVERVGKLGRGVTRIPESRGLM